MIKKKNTKSTDKTSVRVPAGAGHSPSYTCA